MEQNDLKEWGKKLAMIGVIGVVLVGGLSAIIFGPPENREVEAQGGLQTTERNCEFVKLEGQVYFRCGDGFEGKVAPLDHTPQPEQSQ